MWKDLFDKVFVFFVMFGWFEDEYSDFNEGYIFVDLCFKCFFMYLNYEIVRGKNIIMVCIEFC